MIIRIMAIDPAPRDPNCDVIVYQVPEHSRAHELLAELLDAQDIEWTTLAPNPRKKKTPKPVNPLRAVHYANVMELEEFNDGTLIPDDGHGHPAKLVDGVMYENPNLDVFDVDQVEYDTTEYTHVAWYNK